MAETKKRTPKKRTPPKKQQPPKPKEPKKVEPTPIPKETKKPKADPVTYGLFGPDPAPMEEAPRSDVLIFKEIMDKTFDKTDIEVKTDLNMEQIISFSQAKTFARRYNTPLLDELVTNIMELSISKNRQGRKEFQSIAQSSFQSFRQPIDEGPTSIPKRLLGLR